ncbi:MAG: hypothetical protein LBG27_02540 [Spirochaetaceae bacterium]|nr:hypothetical protein [Spirochaetaceae bacterium]
MTDDVQKTITRRNKIWQNNKYIPSWVNLETVGLEQFFTKPEIAKKCYEIFTAFLAKEKINSNDYIFVEPSAGSGVFFHLLPSRQSVFCL